MNKDLLAINVKMKVENVPVGHMLLVTNVINVNQDILVSQIANVCIAVFGIQLFLKMSICTFLNVTLQHMFCGEILEDISILQFVM